MPSEASERFQGGSSLGHRLRVRWAPGLRTGEEKPECSKDRGWRDTHLWAAGLLHLLPANRQDQDAPKGRDCSPLYRHLSSVLPVFQILFSLSHEVYPGLQSWRKNSNGNNNQKLGRQRLQSCFTLTKRMEKTRTDPQPHCYHQLHVRSGWALPPNQSVVNSEKSSGFQSLLDLQIMIQGLGYTYLNKKVSPKLILKYFLGELYKRKFKFQIY